MHNLITQSFSNNPFSLKKGLLFIFSLLLITTNSFAATYYSGTAGTDPTVTTNWWTATNTTGGNPANFTTAGDLFIVQTGHTYATTTADFDITGSLTVNGTFNIGHNTNSTVVIQGDLIIDGGTFGITVVDAPRVDVKGNLTMTGTSALTSLGKDNQLFIRGTFTVSAGATATFFDGNYRIYGAVQIDGSFDITGGSTTAVNFKRFYDDITISTTGSWANSGNLGVRLEGDLTIDGNATFSSGDQRTYFTSATGSITGTTTNQITISRLACRSGAIVTNFLNLIAGRLEDNGTFINAANSYLTLSGSASQNSIGNLDASAAGNTVEYSRVGTQDIISNITYQTYHNLILSGSSDKTLDSDITVNNDLIINAGTLVCEAYQITGNTSGVLTIASGTGLTLGSTTDTRIISPPTLYTIANTTLDANSTVTYQANVNETIPNTFNTLNYGHLVLNSGSTSAIKTPSGSLTIAGDLTIGANTTLADGAGTLTHTVPGNVISSGTISFTDDIINVTTDFTNSGTITLTGGTINTDVDFSNTGTITVTSGSLNVDNNLAQNGTLNIGTGTVDVGVDVSGSGNITFTDTGNLYIGDDFSNTGNLTAGTGTVTYDGSVTQTMKEATYNNLVINNSANTTVTTASSTTVNIGGLLTVTQGSIVANSGSTINVTGVTDIQTNGRIGASSTSGTLNLSITNMTGGVLGYTAEGTINVASLNITGTTNQISRGDITVAGATTVTGTVEFVNTTGSKIFTGDVTVDGTVNNTALESVSFGGNLIVNGAFDGVSGNYTFTGTNKTISGSVTSVTFDDIIVDGTLTNDLDTLHVTDDLSGTGTFTNGSGNVLTLGDEMTVANVDFSTNNTVIFNGTGTQTTLASTYDKVIVEKTSGTVVNFPAGTTEINGLVTITSGNLSSSSATSIVNITSSVTIETEGALYNGNTASIINVATANMTGGEIGGTIAGTINITTLNVTGTTNEIKRANLDVTGATTITGTLDFESTTGTKLFSGDVTVDGTVTNTASESVSFDGNLVVNGIFDGISGDYTFTGTNKTISGSVTSLTFDDLNIDGTVSSLLDSIHVTDDLTGAGTFTNNSNRVLTIADDMTIANVDFSSDNTVIFTGGKYQSALASTYDKVIVEKTTGIDVYFPAGTTNINGLVTVTSGDIATNASTSIININSSATIETNGTINNNNASGIVNIVTANMTGGAIGGNQVGAVNITTLNATGTTNLIKSVDLEVTGITTITGTLDFSSTSGTKTFTGDFIIDGTVTNSVNEGMTFGGDFTLNGIFDGSTTDVIFVGTGKSINGTTEYIEFDDVTITGTYTNDMDTTFVTRDLMGTGSLTNASGNVLKIGDDVSISTLNASINPNTVIYAGNGTQEMLEQTYHHLIIDNSAGNDSEMHDGTTTVNGDLTISSGDLMLDSVAVLNVSGTTTIDTDGVLQFENLGDTLSPGTFKADVNLQALIMTGGKLGSRNGGNQEEGGRTYAFVDVTSLTVTGTGNQLRQAEFTNSGISTITGDLDINGRGVGGDKTFQDDITVDGNWTSSKNDVIIIDKNITVNGTFDATFGQYYFEGTNMVIDGTTNKIDLYDATFNGTYTNHIDTMEIKDDLEGSGSLTLETNNTLMVRDDADEIALLDVLTNAPTTVIYNGIVGDQLAYEGDYYDLMIDNSGGFTVFVTSADIDIQNDLTISQGIFSHSSSTHELTGKDLTVESGAEIQIQTRSATAIIPHFTGTISLDDNSTFTLDGNSTQTLTGPGISYGHITLAALNTKSITGDIDINGNLTISDNTTFNVTGSDFTVNIAGNWISSTSESSSFTPNQGQVIFDGTGAQSITRSGSDGEEDFYDLVHMNTGNTITLNNNIRINNQLDMSVAGFIDMAAQTLSIDNWDDGDITNVGTDRFMIVNGGCLDINGVDVGETANFPLSFSITSTDYCRSDILNRDATNTSFSVCPCNYVNEEGTCSGGTAVEEAVNHTWTITSSSTDTDVTLYWDTSNEQASFDRSIAQLSHFGTIWGDPVSDSIIATNLSGNIYYITASASEFSPFGVGSGGSVLPIELLSFSATLLGTEVELQWTTLTEMNNDFFTLERSADLNEWTIIGTEQGAGTSLSSLDYSYTDNSSFESPIYYYRLKQTDYNGDYTYSDIIHVTVPFELNQNIVLFPNPTADITYLNLKDELIDQTIVINVYSESHTHINGLTTIGTKNVDISQLTCELPYGIYIVSCIVNDNIYHMKLIKE